MATHKQITEALAAFMDEFGYTVTNALQHHEREMREAAGQAQLAAANLTENPDPDLPPPPPGVIRVQMTARGLEGFAGAFTQDADKTDRAEKAWDDLAALLEDDDSW